MASVGAAMFSDPAKNALPELPKSLSSISMTTTEPIEKHPQPSPLPRAASYTYLPAVAAPRSRTNSSASVTVSRTRTNSNVSSRSSRSSRSTATHKSKPSHDDGRIRISNFAPGKEVHGPDTAYKAKSQASPTKSILKNGRKPRTVSDSLANLARKPWGSGSRSPSPRRRNAEPPPRTEKLPIMSQSSLAGLQELHHEHAAENNHHGPRPNYLLRSMSFKGAGLLKKSKKSQMFGNTKASDSGEDSSGPAVPPLPRSMSTNNVSSLAQYSLTSAPPPPLPTSSSTDKLNGTSMDAFRKKDELWAVFRGLEHDFTKFHTKNTALKANVVRSALIPFLVTYADHPSTKTLRPEDLDRRISILNRWWTGLLDLLDGNKTALSGSDRPVLLDGIVGLMAREEWRLPPSPFASQANHPGPSSSLDKSKRSQSSSSLSSTASDFITESIHHNVRNTFVQNLLSQTAIIVDKMSNKTAPASMVIFGGKALAYAFFFCPGLAEILLHLWATPFDSIRRVSREFGIVEGRALREQSELVASGFPPCLKDLGYTSFASTVRWLRKRPPVQPGASRINWHGPWTGRWVGRDSDLFFGFVKQWHVLLEDFLPPDISLKEKALAPAFVLVHAQILTILDATLHRQVSPTAGSVAANTVATSFDEVLGDADATVAALPLPATNVVRLMAENRLIMLLRDVLSKRSAVTDVTRATFAEALVRVLTAATRSISVFDHSACFTLCDFLEESATIMIRYQSSTPGTERMIDWIFWLAMCKQMSKCQNTMSELRLLAFLYSIWGPLTADERRKEGLVLGWLISEETFALYFDHWCPIIRAYYMRLLCWRVARIDEEPSEVDVQILETLGTRLSGAWAQFLHISAEAEARQELGPSTAPCSPAPGRRLLIIRNDTLIDSSLLSSTFEGLIQVNGTARRNGKERRANALPDSTPGSSFQRNVSIARPTEGGSQDDPPKKKWGLLRNIKSLSVSASNIKAKDSPDDPDSPPRRPAGDESPPENRPRSGSVTPEAKTELQHSFRFSLEWMERPHKPSKDRRLYPPRLPNLAYAILEAKRPQSEKDEKAKDEKPKEETSKEEGEEVEKPKDVVEPQSESAQKQPTAISSPPTAPSTTTPSPTGPTTPAATAAATTPKPGGSKYVGRALAEWALIVLECQNFFERRQREGVPTTALVETPVLAMDAFRKH